MGLLQPPNTSSFGTPRLKYEEIRSLAHLRFSASTRRPDLQNAVAPILTSLTKPLQCVSFWTFLTKILNVRKEVYWVMDYRLDHHRSMLNLPRGAIRDRIDSGLCTRHHQILLIKKDGTSQT